MYDTNKHKLGGIMMGLTQFLRHGVGEPDVYERNRPYYLMKKDGVYRHTSTGAMLIKELYTSFGKVSVPGLQNGSVGVDYILPKIPFKYWLMILDFYKAVYEQDGTEAAVHIYYNEEGKNIPEEMNRYKVGLVEDGKWNIYCPQQVSSSTLTSFGDDELYEWFRKNTISVIETHSHHTMDAFWSGTDNRNQQDAQYYGVYGKITSNDNFLMKYVVNGELTNIPVTEVFEFPMIITTETVKGVEGYNVCKTDAELQTVERPYDGSFERLNEFPEKWLTDCHSTRVSYKDEDMNRFTKKKSKSPKKHQTRWYDDEDVDEVDKDTD